LKHTLVILPLIALLCPFVAEAATPREQMIERYRAAQALVGDALKLMGNKKYPEAIAKLTEADKLIPNRSITHYNLACALSMSGKRDAALDALERSIKLGYVDHEHMGKDTDLDPIRESDRFKKLITIAKKKSKPKPPMLHVPTGYKKDGDKSCTLLVTLHGAGGSPGPMFNACKRLLGEDRLLLLSPYGSSRVGPGYTWNGRDLKKVTDKIKELKKTYRINRVYLYGFSAGGHIGYVFVLKHRDLFDGFIPMAGAIRRQWVSKDDLKKAKGLPVYAIQGEADRVVSPAAAKQALKWMKQNGAVTKLFTHTGAHRAPANFGKALNNALKWLDEQQPEEAK
jgi:predicted esterase